MNPSQNFLRFAAICCFLSVITTLGIHVFFPDPPEDFEQRALLFKDGVYLLNRWWVIVHCLLVVISMWGVALVLLLWNPGFAGLGFLFFAVFAIAEITRQFYVLFYINELREQYLLATDNTIKTSLRNTLATAGLLTAPLFGLFIMAFGFGNLFYGISMVSFSRFTKSIGVLLIIWSLANFLVLLNNFWEVAAINRFLEPYNYTYQPLLRLLMGIWLWKVASGTVQLLKPLRQ